tara:strand:- start:5697 stop:6500 length:804 start_codon:yes stop_codon:yes gene_type:complete
MKLEDNLKIDIVDETPQEIKEDKEPKLNENITYDSDDDVLPKDILPTSFVSKPKPADSEIFDDKVEKVVAKVKETSKGPEIKIVKDIAKQPEVKEEAEPSISLHGIPTIKLTKKGRPRKPMTDEHKAKLAIAREKAMAKKKYLANERKIARMKENKDNQSKKNENFEELQAKQKIEMEKLEKMRIERDKEQFREAKEQQNNNSAITRADLEEMSMKTLIAMETMRKKRKEAKKKAKQETAYQQEVMQTIKKAQPSWLIEGSPFNDCF